MAIWGKTWHNKANHGNSWHDKSEDLTRILHKKNSDMTKLSERGHDMTKTIRQGTYIWHDQNYQREDMTRPKLSEQGHDTTKLHKESSDMTKLPEGRHVTRQRNTRREKKVHDKGEDVTRESDTRKDWHDKGEDHCYYVPLIMLLQRRKTSALHNYIHVGDIIVNM